MKSIQKVDCRRVISSRIMANHGAVCHNNQLPIHQLHFNQQSTPFKSSACHILISMMWKCCKDSWLSAGPHCCLFVVLLQAWFLERDALLSMKRGVTVLLGLCFNVFDLPISKKQVYSQVAVHHWRCRRISTSVSHDCNKSLFHLKLGYEYSVI